jgi:hypothetical protein
MNGRIYDPVAARFLQADPVIQNPHDGQNYNRYAYVLNNPLSFTDPTGYSWWTKWRKPILAVAAAAITYGAASWAMMGAAAGTETAFVSITAATSMEGAAVVTTYTTGLSGVGMATAAAAAGFAAGGVSGGNINSALQGAFFAAATSGFASAFDLHGSAMSAAGLDAGKYAGQIGLHSVMGCAQSAAAGGSCKSGAAAGFVSAAGSPFINGNYVTKLIANSVMGAIGSKLGGGKAENGAITGAFGYLFNEGYPTDSDGNQPKDAESELYSKSGRGPNLRGNSSVNLAISEMERRGYELLDLEVRASLPGFDGRRFDFVMRAPDGVNVGFEVKSSLFDRFKLDAKQVAFDVGVYASANGALTTSPNIERIQAVHYIGVGWGGRQTASFMTNKLEQQLSRVKIPHEVINYPRSK